MALIEPALSNHDQKTGTVTLHLPIRRIMTLGA
jgi:hypothetical protein